MVAVRATPRAYRSRRSSNAPAHANVGGRQRWQCRVAQTRRSAARERRERGLGNRHATERVAPWMSLAEVAAQKDRSVHPIVRRIADEDVLALKPRRRHHFENHLAAARTDDLVRTGTAEKRQA